MSELTDKQKRFCEEYVIDWNGTRAAIAAGYSENSAKEIAAQNLSKLNISNYIEHIQKDLSKLSGVSALMNITELKKIAFETDPTKVRHADKMKAIEIINKMLGLNEPDKMDLSTLGEKLNQPTPIQFIDKKQER